MNTMRLSLVVTGLFLATTACAGGFQLTGPTLKGGQPLPEQHVLNGFGCSGGNVSPQLAWQGEPAGTKSFAVTVYDPDAPTGSGWWHWLVFNIPSEVHLLQEGSGAVDSTILPAGAGQGRTDFGTSAYGGACPPADDPAHRYQFTVWALDTDTLPLSQDSSGAMVGYFLNSHVLGKAAVTMIYERH